MKPRTAIAFMLVGCMFGVGIGAVTFGCPAKAQWYDPNSSSYYEMESLNARQRAENELEQQRLQQQYEQERRRKGYNPC